MRNRFLLACFLLLNVSVAVAEDEIEEVVTNTYEPTPLNFGLDLSFASGKYDDYKFSNGTGVGERSKGVNIALEWIPTIYYGKPVIGVSITPGVSANTQVGVNGSGAPIYTSLNVLPVGAYLGYRFDYFVNQVVVPFAKVGTSVLFASETSKTGSARGGSTTGWNFDYSLGAELNLSAIDRPTQRTMDNKFGINTTYLILEYFSSRSLKGGAYPNLSRNEWRLGLRFEI
jgi:hypothetical protein